MRFNSLLVIVISGLVSMTLTAPTSAGSVSVGGYWSSGDNVSQLAQTCIYNIPDNRPFLRARTLVVDNSLPVGAELYSWEYGDFLPNFSISCTGSGITNSTNSMVASNGYPLVNNTIIVNIFSGVFSGGSLINTNIPGIGLMLYYSFQQEDQYCIGCEDKSQIVLSSGSTSDQLFDGYINVLLNENVPALNSPPPKFGFDTGRSNINGSFSIKGKLIKTGSITYGKNINLAGIVDLKAAIPIHSAYDGVNLLAGEGIQIVTPACRLRTKDYTIPMPDWAQDGFSGSLLVGIEVPVNIDLECSGETSNVRFKFEDAGNNKLSDNNISLYQTAGGTDFIDGLEIELLYNNAHVDVDNSTTTNTGNHGNTKVNAMQDPVFDSTSTVPFTARYVQTGKATKNGVMYTGPVVGKVNMWVTYD